MWLKHAWAPNPNAEVGVGWRLTFGFDRNLRPPYSGQSRGYEWLRWERSSWKSCSCWAAFSCNASSSSRAATNWNTLKLTLKATTHISCTFTTWYYISVCMIVHVCLCCPACCSHSPFKQTSISLYVPYIPWHSISLTSFPYIPFYFNPYIVNYIPFTFNFFNFLLSQFRRSLLSFCVSSKRSCQLSGSGPLTEGNIDKMKQT